MKISNLKLLNNVTDAAKNIPARVLVTTVYLDLMKAEARSNSPAPHEAKGGFTEFMGVPIIVDETLPTNVRARVLNAAGKVIGEY